eukprot:1527134-Prorocentrum_lima.AAC.1
MFDGLIGWVQGTCHIKRNCVGVQAHVGATRVPVASHHWQLYALGMSTCHASPKMPAYSAALAMGP